MPNHMSMNSSGANSVRRERRPNLINFFSAACLLVAVFLASFSAEAVEPQAPALCHRLLANSETNTAQQIFDQLARIAREEFAGRRTQFREDPYTALTEEWMEGKSEHSLPGELDSTWLLSVPSPEHSIWQKLDHTARLEILDLLEKAFSGGQYDQALLAPAQNGETSAEKLRRVLEQPTSQALMSRNGHPVGFSPLLFLGAALGGLNVGVCRHSNLAMAGLLVELGLPPEDLRVIAGFPLPEAHGGHLFLEIRAAHNLPWLVYDATGSTLPRQTHNSFFFEPSGSMSMESETSVEALVAARRVLNLLMGLREQFQYNQTVHTHFASPDKTVPSGFFDFAKRASSSEDLSKTISRLLDNNAFSDHLPDKKHKAVIIIDDDDGA